MEKAGLTTAMLSQQSFGIYITHVFVLDILINYLLNRLSDTIAARQKSDLKSSKETAHEQ